MISYGDMLDTIEKNEPQETTLTEKKGGNNVPEKKGGNNVPEKKSDNEPEKKDGEPEDVI